ncbi:MAG: hypothetical protein R2731_01590 [Nocardioides sp.]
MLLDFLTGSRLRVPLHLAPHDLTLLVVDTRVSHALIDGGYAARRADCDEAARLLGVDLLGRADPDACSACPRAGSVAGPGTS